MSIMLVKRTLEKGCLGYSWFGCFLPVVGLWLRQRIWQRRLAEEATLTSWSGEQQTKAEGNRTPEPPLESLNLECWVEPRDLVESPRLVLAFPWRWAFNSMWVLKGPRSFRPQQPPASLHISFYLLSSLCLQRDLNSHAKFSSRRSCSLCLRRWGWTVASCLNNHQNPTSWSEIFWPFINLSFVPLLTTETGFTSERLRGAGWEFKSELSREGGGDGYWLAQPPCRIRACLSHGPRQVSAEGWGSEGDSSLEEWKVVNLASLFIFFLLETWWLFWGYW